MHQLVTTESGSRYLIDRDTSTWERVESSPDPLRSLNGQFTDIHLVIGQPMVLICPPFDASKLDVPRLIHTTFVRSIEEVQGA